MIEIEVRNLQYEDAEWEPIENWKKDFTFNGWYKKAVEAIKKMEELRLDEENCTLIVNPNNSTIYLVAGCTIKDHEDMEFTDMALEYRMCEPLTLELTV